MKTAPRAMKRPYTVAVLVLGAAFPLLACAEGPAGPQGERAANEQAFLATWKLLKGDEKKQFIAGYLFGWSDAARVTDIAADYVRENPTEALDGLTKIRSVYDVHGLKADAVVRELDSFFAEAGNKEATLSQAITAARNRLGR